ncbi:ABC transporter ATP-binding protein [Acidipropionibacterium jensenii]|uniref:Probable siderophore transport system ATP-binding protein YusV n=1 Tax=Acidipropionibacterium jensenii TaxID=1749 RepID=A0A3S4VJK7_9ACTN|nr:ABC transporter ATP-binding protein [Acidipropionibacterium jensenii]MDN5977718.1 ABC transporter ATP-binding protein [Acidipropionibacterium jensenii]MDN5995522.1 ABC transporter ATP-binding protein [Acidipropionibacterium jensenii]MDN6480708.1 ABC transporter ATP-binding protein [Acidipropionibacterium jensenii]MDN6591981.1 ABC transporter ATP-binding protein [Acidipropionibacterium jensenii]MDN6624220.1 ABC transporter ATP-binding protein [Acidipropionibacterium jensenii]
MTGTALPAPAPPGGIRTVDLRVELAGTEILHGIDADFRAGAIHAVLGPNGSGKTTLIRAICGALHCTGEVLLDGRPVSDLSSTARARAIATVWQSPRISSDVTVRRMIGYGRYAHRRWWQAGLSDDQQVVDNVLDLTGLTHLADRRMGTLSGGERQRAWLATALAQQPTVLLLDEPTTYLDIAFQIDILDLVAELNRERGITVIMVLHDLTQAARYADTCLVMTQGRVLTAGAPQEALAPVVVREGFGVDVWTTSDPLTGRPVVQPCRRAAATPGTAVDHAPDACTLGGPAS